MPAYQVQWKYKSGLGGPWEKGEVVELEEWRANHINVDSPGVLVPAEGSRLKVEGKKTGKGGRSISGKPELDLRDRQIKAATNREAFVMGRDKPGYGAELLPPEEE